MEIVIQIQKKVIFSEKFVNIKQQVLMFQNYFLHQLLNLNIFPISINFSFLLKIFKWP